MLYKAGIVHLLLLFIYNVFYFKPNHVVFKTTRPSTRGPSQLDFTLCPAESEENKHVDSTRTGRGINF